MAAGTKYYPLLSDLVQIDQLPKELSIIQKGLDEATKNLFYADYVHERSYYGDKHFYALRLLSFKKVGFDIPGIPEMT